MPLLAELKRRRVIRVSVAYVVVCWLILQVADVIFPAMPLPESAMRTLLVILVLAFPVVVLLAWVFQTTATGEVRREGVHVSAGMLVLLGAVPLVIGAGLGLVWSHFNPGSQPPATSTRPVVAVLPLKDMSPGGDKAYFSDGVHEELISRLAEIRHIGVTSRTTVERYRNSQLSARQIAQQLGVGFILEGSVRHSADRVLITLQFIDAGKDEHIWVREFDERLSMDELFDIQREVARNVASLLRTQLTPNELERLARAPTKSLAAYEAYLKAIFHYRRYHPDDLRLAIDYWHEAVDLDPQYADAWSGMANGYMLAATTYGWMQPNEAIDLARKYGATALRLDPYDGSIISLIGDIAYWYDYDAESAEAKYLEGIAVDPHHFGNRLSYAYLLSTQGKHEEANAQIDYCLEKEPRSAHLHLNAAWRHIDARQYEDVIRHAEIALSIDSTLRDAVNAKAFGLVFTGQLDAAEPLIEDHWVLKPLWLVRSDRPEEARAFVTNLETNVDRPGDLALAYAAAGDTEAAIEQLSRAIEGHHRGVLLMNTWEVFDPVRSDPRFQALLRRVGFNGEAMSAE